MKRLLILFLFVMFIPSVQAACPGNFATTQTITSEDTWTACQITGTASIVVDTGGILHIEGTSIITLNPSTPYQYEIIVQGTGILYINDSEITSADKTWSAVTASTPHTRIRIASTSASLRANNATFSYLGAGVTGNTNLYGINFDSNSETSYITNSTMHDSQGIYFASRPVDINYNNFYNIGTTSTIVPNCCGVLMYSSSSTVKRWQNIGNRFGKVVTYASSSGDKEPFYFNGLNGMDIFDAYIFNTTSGWPSGAHQFNMYTGTKNLQVNNYTCYDCLDMTFNINVKNATFENITYINSSGFATLNSDISNITWRNIIFRTSTGSTFYPYHILNSHDGVASNLLMENWNVSGTQALVQYGMYIWNFPNTRFVNWTWTLGTGTNYPTIYWRGNNGVWDNVSFSNTHDASKALLDFASSTNFTARDVSFYSTSSGNYLLIGSGGSGNRWININDGGATKVSVTGTGMYEKYQYIDVYVQDNASNPVSGASVSFQNTLNESYTSIDRYGNSQPVFTTGANGHTLLPSNKEESPAILEYIKNATTTTYYPYNITASMTNYTSSTVSVTTNDTWYRSNPEVASTTITIIITGSSPDPLNNYIPPVPIINQSSSNLFDVTHTWQPGAGNITDSFNVSWNGTWINGSASTSMTKTVVPHGYGNITLLAYNASGTGSRSESSVTDSLQVLNNPPIQGSIGSKTVMVGSWLNFTVLSTDLDLDTITYGTNASKGNLNIGTGIYTFLATSGDIGTYLWEFNSSDGWGGTDEETITVSVVNTTNVSGYVNTTTTSPCSDCVVYLAYLNNSYETDVGTVTTYSDGLYSFTAVPIGSYYIYAVQSNISSNRTANFTLSAADEWQNLTLINTVSLTTAQNYAIDMSPSIDFDGDNLSYSTNGTSYCTDFSTTTGIGNCVFVSAGTYPINFGVSDSDGFFSNQTIIFDVITIQATYSEQVDVQII